MKRLKLLGVLIMMVSLSWGQTNVDVENLNVTTYYSNTGENSGDNTDSDELMVRIKINFELVNINTISSLNIQVYDTLGGRLNYSQLYSVILDQGVYTLQQQGAVVEEVKGNKYVYFDMPLVTYRNSSKYGCFKVWVTDNQGVASQEKTFTL